MKIADEKNEIIKVLMSANIKKNSARTMLLLHQAKEASSKDIEHGANLKQPEVSVALKDLKKRQLVISREVKKEGKGRPVKAFKLTIPLIDVIEGIQKEKMEEFERVKNSLL